MACQEVHTLWNGHGYTQQKQTKEKEMGRGITVKLPTHKVITALETKLTKVKEDYANQEINEVKYQEAFAQWQKAITDYAIKNIKDAVNFRVNYRGWNSTLNIDYDINVTEDKLPKCPDREFETISHHSYKDIVEDITNALSILRMTEELVVNASTMKQIAKYL